MWTRIVIVDKPRAGRLIGYARVSTQDQNLDMQIEALERAGVPRKLIHVEKVSASSRSRPTFDWMLESLRPGDTLVVWRFDRLGRNVRQVHRTLDTLHRAGAGIRSLTENLDTESPQGEFIINMMASLAQLESDQVRFRTKAGVEAARRRGVRFGQPPKLDAKQRAQCRRWKAKGHTVREIVKKVKSEFGITISHGGVQGYIRPKPLKAKT